VHSIFALEQNAKYPRGREPANEIDFNFTTDEAENSTAPIGIAGPTG
jgi:hypothetical protein